MSGHTAREAGVVETVFAHRFVLKRADGSRLLADIGPKGAQAFPLVEGAGLTIEGERKPSELKVSRLTPVGGEPVAIPRPEHGGDGDPKVVAATLGRLGLMPLGEPRRKAKHFEALARRGGDLVEMHIEFDGHVRKEKPADHEKRGNAGKRD